MDIKGNEVRIISDLKKLLVSQVGDMFLLSSLATGTFEAAKTKNSTRLQQRVEHKPEPLARCIHN
jgi:hypothetical protein